MFWRLFLQTTQDLAPVFEESLAPYAVAVSWYEANEEGTIWTVDATMSTKPDVHFMQAIIDVAAQLMGVLPPQIKVEKIPDTDWMEATWKNFPPRQIGRFYVYGSHSKLPVPENLIGLEINAATAFGSGEHETTTGCLLTLEDLSKDHQFSKPLDMGCGSGILAMAITKLWSIPVLAVDNDPESVRVTKENAIINQCQSFLEAFCSEGFSDDRVQKKGPYDLIVANILAKPLCLMSVDMVANLQPKGLIVLSGLLDRQIEEVVDSYQKAGVVLADQRLIHGWATLTMKKI